MIYYNELKDYFKEWLENNNDVRRLWELNKQGNATYELADLYAKGVSDKWGDLLTEAYLIDTTRGDNLDEIAQEMAKAYEKAYKESAYFTKGVQTSVNKKVGIGLKPVEPKIDGEQIDNLVQKFTDAETTTEMRTHLLTANALQPVARSAVFDTVKVNARLHSSAGLHAYIERIGGSDCCAWCSSVTGRYEYENAPKDIWLVHRGCTCSIDYKPSKYQEAERLTYSKMLNKFA